MQINFYLTPLNMRTIDTIEEQQEASFLTSALVEMSESSTCEPIPAFLATQALAYDSPEQFFQDLLQHGFIAGTIQTLIYYADTHKAFNEYYDNIASTNTPLTPQVINLKAQEQQKNWLCWSAVEQTAREIADEFKVVIHPRPPENRQAAYSKEETMILEQASNVLQSKLVESNIFDSPSKVIDYCRFLYAHLEHEVFSLLLLTNEHRLITTSTLFRGTIGTATIYIREVVKEVLHHNAASVVLAHNHPSGNPNPSEFDLAITNTISTALKLIHVRVLDHIIVSRTEHCSFAERGLM